MRDIGRVELFDHDVVAGRIGLVPAHEGLDLRPQRGGEQHHLALRCRAVEKTTHGGEESHVGHAVRLVDDDGVHRTQVDGTLRHEILETPGTGDDDVDAACQGLARRPYPVPP